MRRMDLHSFTGKDNRTAVDLEDDTNIRRPKAGLGKDLVFVRELFVKALTGVDAWHRPQPQPVSISVWLQTSVARAGSTDHLVYSLNYDVISRRITRLVEMGKFKTLEDIAEKVAAEVLRDSAPGQWGKIHVKKPRALLRAEAAEIIIARRKLADGSIVAVEGTTDVVRIQKLQLVTVIGVNTIERLHRQNVIIDLTLYKPRINPDSGMYNRQYDFREVVYAVSEHVEDSSYKTVEAFVTSVAEVVCNHGVEKVTVRAEKPSAITFADAAGVEITRTRDYFEGEPVSIQGVESRVSTKPPSPTLAAAGASSSHLPLFPQSSDPSLSKSGPFTAYIAFGSNVGDTVGNVKNAIDELNKRDIRVVATSSLYQSEPMYVQEQDKFLNGVFRVETHLLPLQLLDALKDIEYNALGRVKKIDNGPRSIDLDIILYDDVVMNDERLNIPHISMLSRSFVLKPLTDLVSSSETHPLTAESYHSHLEQIPRQSDDQTSSVLKTLIPLTANRKLVLDPAYGTESTKVMAIVNVTPDSFSDGGKITMDNVVSQVKDYVLNQGANILDIGGASTRPNAVAPSTQEELDRVVPAIKAIRGVPELDHIPISIDTYRSEIARAAIEAGADIINDVSAGQMDPKMFSVAKELEVPIILNHTRGTPETMNKLAFYKIDEANNHRGIADDSDEAIIEVVGSELEKRLEEALEAGLRRWQIILDPGFGFAKHMKHDLAIIRNFSSLRSREAFAGLPWLVGTSRKRFIGRITGKEDPKDRACGTGATVTALISQGADIVRIHDVDHCSQVAKMSDAIYRNLN